MNLRSTTLIIAANIILANGLHAQITLDNTPTPEWLVQNVLLGTGVSVSNISFNGVLNAPPSVQIGSYNGVNSNLGLS